MKTDNRTPLRKAVDKLIYEGKIKQDKDLQKIFNKSKSTISTYLNGKPAKNFVTEFEKYFELSLNDFDQPDLKNLEQYIIETHSMVQVILVKILGNKDLKGAQQVINLLSHDEKKVD